jgi:amphi-Trp domain-containing protein
MGDSNKLEFSATLSAAQAAEYLTRISEGLLQGTVMLSAGGRHIQLDPGDIVKLEIEAEGKPEKGKGSLAIELSWKARQASAAETLEVLAGPREAPPAPAPASSEG